MADEPDDAAEPDLQEMLRRMMAGGGAPDTAALAKAMGLPGGAADAGRMLKQVCGTIFAAQLGAVVGGLAADVVSGGDVGVPLLPDGRAALLPQNLAAFGDGLDIDQQQIALYLAVRELAHARLFRHARWLRLGLTSTIGDFSRDL